MVDAVVWDIGRVLVQWDFPAIWADVIPDPEQRAAFTTDVVCEAWHARHDAGEPFGEVVAVAHRAHRETVRARVSGGVHLAREFLFGMVEELGHGDIDGLPDHVEIHPDEIGLAAFKKVLVHLPQMKLAPELRGEFLKHRHIAVLPDQSVHALTKAGRQPSLIDPHPGDGNTLNGVALVNVTLGGAAVQFFAGEDPATQAQREERNGCARHCGSHGTPSSQPQLIDNRIQNSVAMWCANHRCAGPP